MQLMKACFSFGQVVLFGAYEIFAVFEFSDWLMLSSWVMVQDKIWNSNFMQDCKKDLVSFTQ